MHTKKIRYTFEQLDDVVTGVRQWIDRGSIITLSGMLGAGKTAFVQRMCGLFEVVGPIVSPTYAYLSTYELPDVVIYHFDLYRISGIEEFESFGFTECLNDPRGIVLIEWPERISTLLGRPEYQEKLIELRFSYVANEPYLREVLVGLPHHFNMPQDAIFDD